MVRIFKLSWLIMAVVAVCMMCYSCNNGGSINDESNNAVGNESAEKIMKDSLDAITELFDKALISTTDEYVDKNTGRSITDFYCSYSGEDSKYYYFDEMGIYKYKYEKKDVEVRPQKAFAISSNVLEKWTAVFENSKGETVRMFKIDYNGHRIEGGYKCVLLIDNEEESVAVYFGGNNENNGYYDPSKDYSVSELSNYDYNKKYYEGNKLQCDLYPTGIGDYEYGFSFDAENRKIILNGTEYTFKGLVRND